MYFVEFIRWNDWSCVVIVLVLVVLPKVKPQLLIAIVTLYTEVT